jgi:hypothetical protein
MNDDRSQNQRCQDVQMSLLEALSERPHGAGHLGDGGLQHDLGRHLKDCITCQQELQRLEAFEGVLERGFAALRQETARPSQDRIAALLRQVVEHPEAEALRRVRRSVRSLVWLSFLLLSLLAALSLAALAYRVLSRQ